MAASDREVTFDGPCPFCGEMIVHSEVDPCRITVETVKGKWQVWFCHAACFKSKIVPNQYLDLSPAYFWEALYDAHIAWNVSHLTMRCGEPRAALMSSFG